MTFIPGGATSANQTTENTDLSAIVSGMPTLVSGRVPVDPSGVTSPVSAAALPLPAGASTEATLALAKADLDTLAGAVAAGKVKVTPDALPAGSAVIGHVIVDSAPSTAVTGAVTANAGTNLNTSTLALETGGNLAAIKADVDKIPSQGQALAAGSMPVVLTAAQVAALTPPAPISGFALETGGNLAGAKTDLDTLAGTVTGGKIKVTPDLPALAAQDGTDGAAPPTIPGTGIRGWLRSIYDKLAGGLAVTGTFWQATQPVSGTVTANAGTNLNTSTLALETGGNLATVAGAVTAAKVQVNESQVGGTAVDTNSGNKSAGTQRVVLATDQPALTNALKVDPSGVTSPVSLASLPAIPAGTNLIGETSSPQETSTIFNGTTALTPKFVTIVASSSGVTNVLAAVAGKRLRVLRLSLVANGAVNVKFQSHVTPTDLTGLYYLAANGGWVEPFCPVGIFQTVSGEALDINLSGAVAVGGCLTYVEV